MNPLSSFVVLSFGARLQYPPPFSPPGVHYDQTKKSGAVQYYCGRPRDTFKFIELVGAFRPQKSALSRAHTIRTRLKQTLCKLDHPFLVTCVECVLPCSAGYTTMNVACGLGGKSCPPGWSLRAKLRREAHTRHNRRASVVILDGHPRLGSSMPRPKLYLEQAESAISNKATRDPRTRKKKSGDFGVKKSRQTQPIFWLKRGTSVVARLGAPYVACLLL